MTYNREKAVNYANQWAFSRNPVYYNFDALGGDCTNFISQALYAGSGIMNYTPDTGWYYRSLNDRAAAWTGVDYLYKFLTTNKKAGPYATVQPIENAQIGDIIQLSLDGKTWGHSLLITDTQPQILVAAHSDDSINRSLDTYFYQKMRLLHIEGVNPY